MKIIILTICALIPLTSFAQYIQPTYIDSIPMRDDKKLAADIYVPDGGAGMQYPVILIQTPYNRLFYRYYLPLGFGITIDDEDYVLVIVDWRGFYGSAQAWSSTAKKGEDGYDCVEWIALQPWSDGQIGTWGPSALGRCQFETAREKPPHLVCCVPLVAAPQYNYTEYYPGGVKRTEYIEQLSGLGYSMSLIESNPYYNYLWQYVEADSYYPSDIEVPVLMIGGWYDHNIDNMMAFFDGIR
ncbi:MAG: CocE/NonD family hydrolase, partial [Bacteroidetes bacterium]|nr:CocE/NonD family hydrolase [Bacteroidota bacterium]